MSTPQSVTLERLVTHDFDQDIIDDVAQIAERHQSGTTWDNYQATAGFPTPTVFEPKHGKCIEVWDRVPKDHDDTLVVYSSSTNPLNANILFRYSVLAEALPNTRLIAFGSPAGIGRKAGRVALKDLTILGNGDYGPTIESPLAYLRDSRVGVSCQQGLSLGAEKVMSAAIHAERFDHQVTQTVLIEPGSAVRLTHREMLNALTNSYSRVADYQRTSESPVYQDAIANSMARLKGRLWYCSPTNIGIFAAMTRGGLDKKLDTVLRSDSNIKASVIWGEESELAIHAKMQEILAHLITLHGKERLSAMPLKGQGHALGNDVYLHAAATLQALRNTQQPPIIGLSK